MSIKYMNIKEFREQGYLQELNRRFLHPLGLALEIVQEEDGSERLGGIWDYRDDEEGVAYSIKLSNRERIDRFKKNEDHINKLLEERSVKRKKLLGFDIEPIPENINKE